ncbi:hypothetical protein P692DRAFT_20724001 [Suillus brevipes Sb2]|nr:hypothetical protein P692DRAFT_20724001 [Suillus brevipes Sb2]
MSQLEEYLHALEWNNNIAVAIITLISYEYILMVIMSQVTFVWERQWSVMTYLYLVVRYFGIILGMICALWGGLFYMPEAVSVSILSLESSRLTQIQPYVRISCYSYGMFVFMQWGFSAYFCLAEGKSYLHILCDTFALTDFAFAVILIWRLYVLYQSKLILYILLGSFLPIVALYIAMDIFLWSRPSSLSVQEIIITPGIKYCTAFFHMGPMPAVYASIPVICFDIFLVVLAVAVLGKHLKERKELKMKPNTYVVMIVRYHIIYFVLNLASQIFIAMLWAHLPTIVLTFILLFKDTAPLIVVPRFIISIWDTHANDNCINVSTTFEDCVCWTSPPKIEQPETDSRV